MYKIYWLFCMVLVLNSHGKNLVSLLKGIESNHVLHMQYKRQPFICTPYGVETVSELVDSTDVNSSCMQYLKEFRLTDPNEKYFAIQTLWIEQQYSVEGVEGRCLLHLSSGHSYSEALLEKGYARMPIGARYKDPVLRYRFKQAERRAKTNRAGLWSDVNVRNCFLMVDQK